MLGRIWEIVPSIRGSMTENAKLRGPDSAKHLSLKNVYIMGARAAEL